MELERQRQLAKTARDWFDNELKTTIKDNRRRYNMKLKDESQRKSRDLSCLPSTKSTAAVDRFVESSLIVYHTDPDSISFTPKAAKDPVLDGWAKWLTEIFSYRAENDFPFFTWHHSSLNAGGVDGLEAALVWWRKESYTENVTKYRTFTNGQWSEVPKQAYDQYSSTMPELFSATDEAVETVSLDTFWIDQLEPGVEVFWDPNIPLLNVNLGQFGLVKLWRSPDDLRNLASRGIINPIDDEDLKAFQKSNPYSNDSLGLAESERENSFTTNADLGDKNLVELWMFFDKEAGRWGVQFSLEGKHALSERKTVDEVFFAGRKVNRLPFVVGTTKLKLWKAAGRAIPETIAPLEDQHTDHINNVNDAVKSSIQGRYRVNPDSDLNVDDLLNRRIVYADPGEYERINDEFGIISTLRVDDSINMGINELVPVGMASGGRGVVPKGTDKTLGALQVAKLEGDEKQGVHIKTRNETFLKPVLWLVVQNIFAFETDDQVLRKAAANANIDPPIVTLPNGQQIVDHTKLDFGVDVQINAGLGAAPRYQKAQNAMQIAGWRVQNNVPTDTMAIARHLNVLAGFGADQFTPNTPPQPPPPKVEHKVKTDIPFNMLPPQAQQVIIQQIINGQAEVDANVKQDNLLQQNGGGMFTPNRTGQIVDTTGQSGAQMSAGGMQNGQEGQG